MANTRTVTNILRAAGYPMELVNGGDYFYFVYEDGEIWETRSEMVFRFNHMTVDQWVEAGVDFGNEMKTKHQPEPICETMCL